MEKETVVALHSPFPWTVVPLALSCHPPRLASAPYAMRDTTEKTTAAVAAAAHQTTWGKRKQTRTDRGDHTGVDLDDDSHPALVDGLPRPPPPLRPLAPLVQDVDDGANHFLPFAFLEAWMAFGEHWRGRSSRDTTRGSERLPLAVHDPLVWAEAVVEEKWNACRTGPEEVLPEADGKSGGENADDDDGWTTNDYHSHYFVVEGRS